MRSTNSSSSTDWPAKRIARNTNGSRPACTCLPKITTKANSTAMSAHSPAPTSSPRRSVARRSVDRAAGHRAASWSMRCGTAVLWFGCEQSVRFRRTCPKPANRTRSSRSPAPTWSSSCPVLRCGSPRTTDARPSHVVTLSGADWDRLGAGYRSPEAFVRGLLRVPARRTSPRNRSWPRSTSARSPATSQTSSARSSRPSADAAS